MSKTVAAELWGTVPPVQNHCTIAHPAARPVRIRRDLRDLFVGAYGMFAARCRAIDEPGIAVVGIEESSGRPAGVLTLLARVQRYVAGIVGRHDACDLFLHGCGDLALRQLAVVLEPVHSWAPRSTQIRYRVLDLRTSTGFFDESGRPLRGLRCEGPAIMRCGGFALFVLPLGDPTDWPESAGDAWAMMPERVYIDELERGPAGSMPMPIAGERRFNVPGPASLATIAKGTCVTGANMRSSVILRTHGPRETGASFARAGDHAGSLELIGRQHRGTLTLGDSALRDGVLLGRYARCDGAGLLDDPSLSRVHGLLLQLDTSLVFVDTASRNGSRMRGEPDRRLFVLDSGSELELGHATRARWRWGDA